MKQNQPLISIIVPVYNAKKTLSVCLDSLYAQTYKSLELLFIDDCCSDDSFEIINRYIFKNKSDDGIVARIFRHEKNRGVAAARNTGLDHARGEYVYYVDADDTIEPETLFELVKKAQCSGADITGCEWFLSYSQNKRHMKQPEIVSPIDAFRKMTGGILRWNLWVFLVKRSVYEDNGIRFIEGMNMGEDMMVMGKLFLCADKVAMLHKPFYHYMQTNFTYLEAETSGENRSHVTRNIVELERFARIRWGDFDERFIHFLKLNIKLPLLITQDTAAYRQWLLWFPESNAYILQNKMLSLRLRLLQWMAAKEQFWFLKLYYKLIIRFVYGVLYK